jgi:hypothetical protein
LNRQPDYLLIDVSNSFTKLAFASRRKLGVTRRLPTSAIDAKVLGKIICRRKPKRVVVS